MTHVPKNGCKSFHRYVARVQYDDGDFFRDCVYTFCVDTHFSIVHNSLDSNPNTGSSLCFPFIAWNIGKYSILFTCLFISIDFFELIGPIQLTHTRLSHEILTFPFMCSIYFFYSSGGILFMHPYNGNERKLKRTIKRFECWREVECGTCLCPRAEFFFHIS